MRVTARLTRREKEVAALAARGLPNKIVARQLGIEVGTVKTHLHNVYMKLGVANRMLMMMAINKEG